MAAFWFYEIWKRDKEFAGQIIGKFRVRELKKLTKMIPKIDPLSRELKNKFFREISEIFLNKNQFPKTDSKVLLTGSFNIFFIIFSLTICLILLWIKLSSFLENNLLKPGQDVWLTAMGLSILLPFFLSSAIKNKYFSRNQAVLQSFFSIFTSSLLLIGLISILNYLSVSTNVVHQQKGYMVIIIIFFTSLLGPWIEEVLFRGLLFDQVISFFHKKGLAVGFFPILNSRDSLSLNSIIWAFVLTSIAFAFIHKWESPSGFFIYFLCGIILSWQRYQSGSLWDSWLSHAIANGVIVFS